MKSFAKAVFRKPSIVYVALITITTLASCKQDKPSVDISKVRVKVDVKRMDRAIAAFDKNNLGPEVLASLQEYGSFAELYSTNIIKIGSMYNAEYLGRLKLFLNYELNDDINKEIARVFGSDSTSFAPELTEAFKHYKYYYPGKPIPLIYTYNGGFNQSIVIDSGMIGIGLDKYLGSGSHIYRRLEMEEFKKRVMIPSKVTPDCMQALVESEFPYNFVTENVLSYMIHEGRNAYFVSCMMPALSDTTLWGFTTRQLQFCENYERNMWTYLIDNKMLFNTDYMNIKRFTGEGPFTVAFSKESPSRAASWIGYRIVIRYLENNPKLSLQDLMAETDYQKIMNKAKYNP